MDDLFQPAVREWFRSVFPSPTAPQTLGWPVLARGDSALLLAPTGSGKTLAAFLTCIDRVMFSPPPPKVERCRILYISPLKALAVDVERNLRAPIVGIANVAAGRGDAHRLPTVAVRTGDTPPAERARWNRDPADILITTPESLYLLLTSRAREGLRHVDTVIVDEIHALVPGKRGAHLALSLERLEAWVGRPLQRIGLSATQRPLEEVARFLGGATVPIPGPGAAAGEEEGRAAALPRGEAPIPEGLVHAEFSGAPGPRRFRPVTVVDAGSRKALELRIEIPVEDMARIGQPVEIPSGPASQGPVRTSIWTAIHPRLLELVRAHTSTLIFVNSRRISERLAAALNELAGETLVLAHHGSIARAQRMQIEDRLKAGQVRGLVATSSLELGIDMGAVDLVVQIEAPPSVASGMQRIGRAGHRVDTPSRGVVFPKYRGDLLACAALTEAMHAGEVESTRYPRNPLDVLAQQIVAMASIEPWDVEALFALVRRAAPFVDLSRPIFEGVLDLLSGRYVSEDFAELRPRLTWDRLQGTLTAREGAQRLALVNGGTIADRGLFGVFLAGGGKQNARVGELDEEMVFECRPGETFLLGASTWRIEEITHDRVLVSPAPGEPGKMPFWHGDAAGRPLEMGQRIGRLVRELRAVSRPAALARLARKHDLDPRAAENLLAYLDDQAAATQDVPDDRTLVVERTRDELGDWRVCILSPFGGRVHAPMAMAIAAQVRDRLGIDVETLWTDDGMVVRFPESDAPPDLAALLPSADEAERLVLRQLSSTALFAAKFRESAARALLLPRRRPGSRTPLWQQRKRASDLLAVASRHGGFPILLETYRECLRDVFDMPALAATLQGIQDRRIRLVTVDTATPSPFASSILFGFVANYIYDGDAPLAERRAQALSIDQSQLRDLLGEAELRELLDLDALAGTEAELQQRDPRFRARSVDGIHDLLLRVGDLTREEIQARCASDAVAVGLETLLRTRRAVPLPVAGESRYVAVEDAGRYRDGLGVPLPDGLPEGLLEDVPCALEELAQRFARTHAPFTTAELSLRLAVAPGRAEQVLEALVARGRLLEGAFRPGGTVREWCDPGVLATIRRRSLAKLRHEIEPVAPHVLGRLATTWQGVTRRRSGMDALLDAIERLQGCALPASVLETEVLPARVERYNPADLDALASAGEVVWAGVEPLGDRDGRLALYLTDHLPRLIAPPTSAARTVDTDPLAERELAVLDVLRRDGASFFASIHAGVGGGFPRPTLDALWTLAWKGLVTNDTFRALRAFVAPPSDRGGRRPGRSGHVYRSRRGAPPAAEGRWSLLEPRLVPRPTRTEWSAAIAQQLLARYGVVSREVAQLEGIPGGFSAVYDVFKAMEEAGQIRRGYFVTGVGATQFALPAAVDLLRGLRELPEPPEVVTLAATDPANPYGALLRWPEVARAANGRGPTRTAGARVVLVNGAFAGWLGKGGRQAWVCLPEDEPDRSRMARAVAAELAVAGRAEGERRGGMLLEEVNGAPAAEHPIALLLVEAGFVASSLGFHLRRERPDFAALLKARPDA